MHILDSSIIIELIGGSELGRKAITAINEEHLATTVISMVEVLEGTNGKIDIAAASFFDSIPILSLDIESAIECIKIQKALKRNGTPLGRADLFIAGICKKNDATLVTCDNGFKKVNNLKIALID